MTAVLLVSCGLQLGLERAAHADGDPSATETAAARALAVDGLKLAQAGNCEEAIGKLERAEKLHHSVVVLSRLGECHVSQGHLIVGTEMLRKVLREPLPPNPSSAISKAHERAQSTLDSAKLRIATLTISVSGSAGSELSLSIDGESVPATLVDTDIPADPGEHLVEANAPGFLKAVARVTLGAADKKSVALRLERDPSAAVAAAPRPESAGTTKDFAHAEVSARPEHTPLTPPAQQRQAANYTPSYVAWSLGAVGVGVGAVFGVVAMKDKSALDERCTSDVCPSSESSALDSARRAGNISTVAFGVGGLGLAVGTVLYLATGSSAEESGALAKPKSFIGLSRPRASVARGRLQFGADF